MPHTTEQEVAERLAKINALMAKKTDVKYKPDVKVACPIDPAERALCEGCQ